MPCVYDIDASLRLAGVNARWIEFARANGAPGLVPPDCLGRPVLEGTDPTTAQVYRRLFERVRETRAPVSFGIRCDAPALRRWLTLTISPREGGFEVRSVLDRAEAREPVPLMAAPALDAPDAVRMCSWCKRCLVDGAWVEAEEAVRALGLFARDSVPPISHGMCESCFAGMETLLN